MKEIQVQLSVTPFVGEIKRSYRFAGKSSYAISFEHEGRTYSLNDCEMVFPAYYLNEIVDSMDNSTRRWYYTSEYDGLASLVCKACKYLVPQFYWFYKQTDGVDSTYLCEHGISFDVYPGLVKMIDFIKETITLIRLIDNKGILHHDYELYYVSYDEVRSIIRKNKSRFAEWADEGIDDIAYDLSLAHGRW